MKAKGEFIAKFFRKGCTGSENNNAKEE